jgi:hypothetical protein
MAIVTTVESALPNASIFSGISQILGVVWVSTSVSFNVLVTSLICGRIFVSYLTLQRMGHASNARERWGVFALLIESSLPFSVFGIVFAAFYGLPVTNPNSQLVSTMADIWGGIVVSSPQFKYRSKGNLIEEYRHSRGFLHISSFCVWQWAMRGRRTTSAQEE